MKRTHKRARRLSDAAIATIIAPTFITLLEIVIRRLPPTATGLLCCLVISGKTLAAQCPAPAYLSDPDQFTRQPGAPVQAEADRVVTDNGIVTLEGNTTIEYQGRTISAQNALYNPATGELSVTGDLSFLGEGIKLNSSDALIDLDDDLFSAGDSEYEMDLKGKRATGSAATIEALSNGDFAMTDATYSTCPAGDNSWYVRADSLKLYPEQGIGTARNLRLVFKGVPLMALPAFSFPIGDQRKTGFLAPILARGETTGVELHIPWYWNIRPNLDATFTPRLMSKRGAQLQSEFRYLNRQGLWTLNHEYLEDRELEGQERYFTQLRHNGRFNADVTSTIVASRISDKDYLDDLGDSLQTASITHLEQRADLNFNQGNIQALLRLQGFQTVDEAIGPEDRPHSRLPQFKLDARSDNWPKGLIGKVNGEFVYFDKDDAVTGLRMDIQPTITLPLVRDAWFIRPSVSHRFTYYSLNNTNDLIPSTNSRSLNAISLDAGLFFDRAVDNKGSVQTLEPRLFYLRVPFADQSDIPIFDSSAFDFNISQLFRDNRFSGADRVADANQLSLAMTTRMINGGDGSERFRASLGQIIFFDDRRVSLPPINTVDQRDTSDFVAEVSTTLTDNWIGAGNIQWNPEEERTVRSALSVGYRNGPNRIANVTHRVVNSEARQEKTEQIDLSGLWKVGDSWRVASRWNYSLDSNRSIESLLGLEYESCCWAMRFAARRYISDDGEDHDTSLYIQLVLKGLAPLGQNYGALLENNILGYRDNVQ